MSTRPDQLPDPSADRPAARTIGELRESGWRSRSVKSELRSNLLARLGEGRAIFPGVIGYADSVLPAVENAILAGQDLVFLGERGQGKTRMARLLVGLLDPWLPVIAGGELNDDPFAPISPSARALVAEGADETPIAWLPRDRRYGEKLATPDISIADLIGEVDPIRVAEGRYLSDELVIHYGLIPRSNRGIFAINELPDLAERIQVGLLNILEERDVQVRGFTIRLPLDLFVVASANPEDYTNRGRIITPLKDRFGAEIRTHYPLSLEDELELINQEAAVSWDGQDPGADLPVHLIEVIARFTRLVRESPAVDSRSGVSARFAIAAAESAAAAAVRRTALIAEARDETPVARVADLPGIVPTLRGKVEFEVSEEGREEEILNHLLRRAIAETFRARLGGADLSGLLAKFEEGGSIESGELVSATELLRRTGEVPGLARIMARLGMEGRESFGEAAAAIEFVLEGLYLIRRLSKDTADGTSTYRT